MKLPRPIAGLAIAAAKLGARSVLGVRYTWGGESPSTGFDCSGLVLWAWAHGGKSLSLNQRKVMPIFFDGQSGEVGDRHGQPVVRMNQKV